jgi:hypothetical protein
MFEVQGWRHVPYQAGRLPAQTGLPSVWLLPLEMPEVREDRNEEKSQRRAEGGSGIGAAVSFCSFGEASNPVQPIAA